MAATVAVIATIAVVVAKTLGTPILAAFVAGLGSTAVVAYVTVARRLIRDARRRG
jgi:hypothetical protein